MSDLYVKIDLGKAGALYVHPVGNDRFAHLYISTNPDGGGPIGQATSVTVRGVDYTVSAHRDVNPDGRSVEEWERWPGGTIKREGICASRKGSFSFGRDISVPAWESIRLLIDRACMEYLARPEAAEEIRAARTDELRMRIESLERDEKEAQDKLNGIRADLKARRAALKGIACTE